jgi:hypothetical protein
MSETEYRLSWEMVSITELWRFSNADPMVYKNTTQQVPNSEIPDEYWKPISKIETDERMIRDQYEQLCKWSDADEQFVRKVVLEESGTVDHE